MKNAISSIWRLALLGLGLGNKPTENKLTRSGRGLSRLLAISEEIDLMARTYLKNS